MQSVLYTILIYKYLYTILKLYYSRSLILSSSLYYYNLSYFDKEGQEN